MHQVKRFVDVIQRQIMRHELVDLHVAFHILVDQLGNTVSALPTCSYKRYECSQKHRCQVEVEFNVIKQACTIQTSESGSLPGAPSNELEGARGDLLAGGRHANDGGDAPALVTRLQRRPHRTHVTDTLEGEVRSAVSHLNQHLLDRLGELFGVDTLRGAKRLRCKLRQIRRYIPHDSILPTDYLIIGTSTIC